MIFTYKPQGVCSTSFEFDIEDNIVKDLKIEKGCDGNAKGVSALLKGRNLDDIIATIDGITCKTKGTSCPDQIAQALKAYKETSK